MQDHPELPLSSEDPKPKLSIKGLPDIESVAEVLHDRWVQKEIAKGNTSRKIKSGEELMVPYRYLSDGAKSLDRALVEIVYAAIVELL